MSESFNPYHRWLGIREEQPTFYRLLGVDPFEDDPDVIEDGAERQIAHVRNYQTGKHAEQAHQLLKELTDAKRCLTQPDRKQFYDQSLRAANNAIHPTTDHNQTVNSATASDSPGPGRAELTPDAAPSPAQAVTPASAPAANSHIPPGELIERVARVLRETADRDAEIEQRRSKEAGGVRAEHQRQLAAAEREHHNARAENDSECEESLAALAREYRATSETATGEHQQATRKLDADIAAAVQEADAEELAARDRAKEGFKVAQVELRAEREKLGERIDEHRRQLDPLREEVDKIVRRRRCRRAAAEVGQRRAEPVSGPPLDHFLACLQAARNVIDSFAGHTAPKIFSLERLLLVAILGTGGASVPILMKGWMGENALAVVVVSLTAGLALAGIAFVLGRPLIIRQTIETYEQFLQWMANAELALQAASKFADREYDRQEDAAAHERDRGMQAARAKRTELEAEIQARRATATEAAEQLQAVEGQRSEKHEAARKERKRHRDDRRAELDRLHEERRRELEIALQDKLAGIRRTHERQRQELLRSWTDGIDGLADELQRLSRFGPVAEWDEIAEANAMTESAGPPTTEQPAQLVFGTYDVDLESVAGRLPGSPELMLADVRYQFPVAIDLATHPALIVKAELDGRSAACRILETVAARLIATLPARLRVTVIDPRDRGQSFPLFQPHVEKTGDRRLFDLAAVTPEDVERHVAEMAAGDSAVTRILLVANFPAGFTDDAAVRFAGVIERAAELGVCVLLSIDTRLDLPPGFAFDSMESNALTLDWTGERFVFADEQLARFALTLAAPPTAATFARIAERRVS